MKLVIDASVGVAASATPVGFAQFRGMELVAPALMWIEAGSVLHATMWRGELRRDQAEPMFERRRAAPIKRVEPRKLQNEACRLADEMGWETYDALTAQRA